VAALAGLADRVAPGDQVYLHYSGHGGRVPTAFPELKGPHGLDETLVPCDIAQPDSQHLRDIELAALLNRLVRRGVFVTVVLDCCHSGGATRGPAFARPRGISEVDRTLRPEPSLVGSAEQLVADWLAAGGSRAVTPVVGWLPDSNGYVLLAACRPHENAYEFPFDGVATRGALSYWLLRTLAAQPGQLTYRTVYDSILGRIHGRFPQQTPMLLGEADRALFAGNLVERQVGVVVLDATPSEVRLATGTAQSIEAPARFAIYASRAVVDSSGNSAGAAAEFGHRTLVAEVEVTHAEATKATARVLSKRSDVHLQPGMLAVLLDLGTARFRRTVAVVAETSGRDRTSDDLSNSTSGPADTADPSVGGNPEAVAAAIEDQIASDAHGFIGLAAAGAPPDLMVIVDQDGGVQIADAAGMPLPNVPADQASKAASADLNPAPPGLALARRTTARLVHLSRFHAVRDLENRDLSSPLAGTVKLAVVGRQLDYIPGTKPSTVSLDDRGPNPWLKAGEWVFIQVRNTAPTALNVAILDLQPDWGISQVLPPPSDSDWMPLDPGEDWLFPLRAQLPDGADCTAGGTQAEYVDVLMAVATIGPTSFRWLELPSIGLAGRPASRTMAGSPMTALERLFASLTMGTLPARRNLVPPASESTTWTTASLELRIRA